MRIFFTLFVVLPLLELWLLIKVGAAVGGWLMLLWVIATGVIGLSLLKRQGLAMLWGFNRKVQSGELQVAELVEGVLQTLPGVLLLIPGLITDCIGLVLLSPKVRRLCAGLLLRRMTVPFSQTQDFGHRQQRAHPTDQFGVREQDIIEGEYHEINDDRNLPKS